MLFSTPLFVFGFLPLVLAVVGLLPRSLRNAWLLLGSLVFYAWGEPVVVLVMLGSIAANFAFGLGVERARRGRGRGAGRGMLALAVAFNLGLLFLFKYAGWLYGLSGSALETLGLVDGPLAPLGSGLAPGSFARALLLGEGDAIRLPIGISFFTFQALSYVVDVWRGAAPVCRNPLDVALYVALFPQLVAGPIVRYSDVAAQIRERRTRLADAAYGIRRFVLGLAKKVLVANVCAESADAVFALPTRELTPALAWLGVCAYAVQIYFDFSGYSDMAIGIGRMLGFRFLENFDYPYVARSITEFWRRWHLSLSTWFRDYLYVPLGGNRRGPARTYRNLVIVFLLCGLWHGASLTFVVWGLYHGAWLVVERLGAGRWLARRPGFLQHAYTLLVVLVGWVFFRAETLGQALDVLATLVGAGPGGALAVGDVLVPASTLHPLAAFATARTWVALGVGALGSAPLLPALVRRHRERAARGGALPALAELGGLLVLLLLLVQVAFELAAGGYDPFIYFRF